MSLLSYEEREGKYPNGKPKEQLDSGKVSHYGSCTFTGTQYKLNNEAGSGSASGGTVHEQSVLVEFPFYLG